MRQIVPPAPRFIDSALIVAARGLRRRAPRVAKMRSLFMGDANNSFSVVIAATARRQRGLARSPRGHRSSQVIELSAQCPVNGEGNLSMKKFAIR